MFGARDGAHGARSNIIEALPDRATLTRPYPSRLNNRVCRKSIGADFLQ